MIVITVLITYYYSLYLQLISSLAELCQHAGLDKHRSLQAHGHGLKHPAQW